jgi:Tfp pilus assembly protein PilO
MQTNNRQQLLMVLAIAAVALFAGDKLILSPLIDAWKARSERIAHLTAQITQGKSLLAREKGLRSRWDQMRRNTLPVNTSAAEQQLFKALDSWERDSRVIVTARTPQWKHDSEEYTTYECRVDVSGNLGTLSKFLYDVESEPMALKLESVP